jgi:hypothetical protein
MLSEHDIWGESGQCDEPDWRPLIDLVGIELAAWFMWMSEIELDDDTRVHAYKHICTRRYFHLAVDGRAYVYVPRYRYREINRQEAINIAFECWKELCPQEEHDAIRAALRRARRAETVRTREVAATEES